MTAPERLIRDLCTTRPSNPSSKPQWTLRYIRALSRPVTPISQPLRPRTRLGELQRDGAHRATRSHVSGVHLGDFESEYEVYEIRVRRSPFNDWASCDGKFHSVYE